MARSRRARVSGKSSALTPTSLPLAWSTLTWPAICVGCALVLIFFALYFRTAARSVVVGDNPELLTAAFTLGVPHPPGYPVLVLIGHLFSLLPIEPLAFRLNLLAVVCGAMTLALVYLTAWRLTGNWAAAAIAAAALGVNSLFWEWSLALEAFPLNNLLAAGLVYTLVASQMRSGYDKYLVGAALLGGIGLANHQTIVLLGPAALFTLWQRRDDLLRQPTLPVAVVIAFAAGLLPYTFIPWAAARKPFLSWGDVSSVSDLVALVSRADYGTGRLASEYFQGGSGIDRVVALIASFTPLQGVLLLAGIREVYVRARPYFWLVVLGFLFAGPVFVSYANMNPAQQGGLWQLGRFFLLPHVVVAPIMAFGVIWGVRKTTSAMSAFRPVLVAAVATCLILVVLVLSAITTYAEVDQSENSVALHHAQDVLDSVPSRSILLANGDENIFPLAYLHAAERKRPDVTLVMLPLIGTRAASWYVRYLMERYPDLMLPRSVQAGGGITEKDLVGANSGRPIVRVGPSFDRSVDGTYGCVYVGLVCHLRRAGEALDFVDIVKKNEAMSRHYRIPNSAAIKRGTFEVFLLRNYALHVAWVANQYQLVARREEAADWYRRALAIDPDYAEARLGLTQVGGQ